MIYVRHYKDVFNRSHQSFMRQKAHQALILAKKEGQLIYEGAPVCQNFGNYYFYYKIPVKMQSSSWSKSSFYRQLVRKSFAAAGIWRLICYCRPGY